MALGEWLSVQSSRELYANQIAVEAEELAAFPEEEEEELRLIYEAKGMEPDEARRLAHRDPHGDRARRARHHGPRGARDRPGRAGGSAWTAAITSFVLFASGPRFRSFRSSSAPVRRRSPLSAVLSAAALFVLGAAITLMTGRNPLWSGLRQLVFGLAAAAVTYTIGWLLGTAVL